MPVVAIAPATSLLVEVTEVAVGMVIMDDDALYVNGA